MRSKKAIKNIISSLVLQIVILVSGFIVPKLIIKTFGSNVNSAPNTPLTFKSPSGT